MKVSPEEIFVRRYDEVRAGLRITDDFDVVELAATLRKLLIDGKALIDRANQKYGLKIRFTVNNLKGGSKLPNKPDFQFYADGINPAKIKKSSGIKSLKLKKFLKLEIAETKDDKFNISEIIKYLANKKGGIHYDENLDKRESLIADTFDNLNILGFSAFTLGVRAISEVVLDSLAPLYNEIVKIPDSIPLIANFTLGKCQTVQFSNKQALHSEDFNIEIDPAFGWGSILKISKKPTSGKHTIFKASNDSNLPELEIYINDNGDLCSSFTAKDKVTLITRAVNFSKSKIFDSFFFFLTEICIDGDEINLYMYINNELVEHKSSIVKIIDKFFKYTIIGGNTHEHDDVDFSLREIVMSSKCLTESERSELANYFWLKWKN
ncbi:hypothetical protein DYD21_20685 [Rhodohalobacter sp. SW132]|uniref:hypothetical protein n=1 Tax=Rhodohalobacter sp. SW132 TaxID=2293433 RepID=UPI000E2311E0|nr:hypothetical protein [Rhodohalobacter sp. SW132]REL23929.1 hypothetical protein DYD21_20685 [Rhodohalobacter sp. SW132]